MMGDLILLILKSSIFIFIRKHFLCVHKYQKWNTTNFEGDPFSPECKTIKTYFLKCEKCERRKEIKE